MIKISFIGNLGGDAALKNVNGKNVINFSVAHTEKYKDQQGNQRENTLWISCSWWLDRVNILDYLKKGTQVYVEGEPSVTTYTGPRGEALAQQRCRVQSLQLLGSKPQNNSTTSNNNQNSSSVSEQEIVDDLPF